MSKLEKQEKINQLKEEKRRIEEKLQDPNLCEGTASLYSRVSGYYRAVNLMNTGKRKEVQDRINYSI